MARLLLPSLSTEQGKKMRGEWGGPVEKGSQRWMLRPRGGRMRGGGPQRKTGEKKQAAGGRGPGEGGGPGRRRRPRAGKLKEGGLRERKAGKGEQERENHGMADKRQVGGGGGALQSQCWAHTGQGGYLSFQEDRAGVHLCGGLGSVEYCAPPTTSHQLLPIKVCLSRSCPNLLARSQLPLLNVTAPSSCCLPRALGPRRLVI